MDNIIPFGKYKGQPIEVLQHDSEYLNWLQSQEWFLNRYQSINTLIVNNFQEPSETPEHNKIQVLFLEQTVCEKLMNFFVEREILPLTGVRLEKNSQTGMYENAIRHYNYTFRSVEFEQKSVDVTIHYEDIDFAIEIKPIVSDDYPAVIRQMQSNKSKILICKEYTGQGATLEQVRKIFYQSGRLHFILLSDFL